MEWTLVDLVLDAFVPEKLDVCHIAQGEIFVGSFP